MYKHMGVLLATVKEVDTTGIEPLVVELLTLIDNYFPVQPFLDATTVEAKQEYLKMVLIERIQAAEEARRAYGWSTNPDRMGQ